MSMSNSWRFVNSKEHALLTESFIQSLFTRDGEDAKNERFHVSR